MNFGIWYSIQLIKGTQWVLLAMLVITILYLVTLTVFSRDFVLQLMENASTNSFKWEILGVSHIIPVHGLIKVNSGQKSGKSKLVSLTPTKENSGFLLTSGELTSPNLPILTGERTGKNTLLREIQLNSKLLNKNLNIMVSITQKFKMLFLIAFNMQRDFSQPIVITMSLQIATLSWCIMQNTWSKSCLNQWWLIVTEAQWASTICSPVDTTSKLLTLVHPLVLTNKSTRWEHTLPSLPSNWTRPETHTTTIEYLIDQFDLKRYSRTILKLTLHPYLFFFWFFLSHRNSIHLKI